MWDMVKHSMVLFFQGKLFKNNASVFQKLAVGVAVTAVVLVVLALLGLPLALAAALAGAAGGALQPYLFKDLKYQ
jgi:drug/metabolite transporter (DMT)-like permease